MVGRPTVYYTVGEQFEIVIKMSARQRSRGVDDVTVVATHGDIGTHSLGTAGVCAW